MNEIKECAICAAKPGSPELCLSCLANRSVGEGTRGERDVSEDIRCAAIWYDDGEYRTGQPMITGIVLCGHRHTDIIRLAVSVLGRQCLNQKRGIEGFLTSRGRFVDRMEAYVIALEAGQTKANTALCAGKLSSDDLY